MSLQKIGRTYLKVKIEDLNKIEKYLKSHSFQTTPLQLGTIKKIGEGFLDIIDSVLEFLGFGRKIKYKSDEVFGLVMYIGKKQQIHIRGYIEGRIESEIEPLGQYFEHVQKTPKSNFFDGYWYSAHETVKYLFETWKINYNIVDGNNGEKYNSDTWKSFDEKKFYKAIMDNFPVNGSTGKSFSKEIVLSLKSEIARIKSAPFNCLVKKALLKSGFKSYRKCN